MPDDDGLILSLADLLPDENGEVVITSGELAVTLVSDRAVQESGLAGVHHTAAGIDVSGFGYVAFAGGPTVFCQDPEGLLIAPTGEPI